MLAPLSQDNKIYPRLLSFLYSVCLLIIWVDGLSKSHIPVEILPLNIHHCTPYHYTIASSQNFQRTWALSTEALSLESSSWTWSLGIDCSASLLNHYGDNNANGEEHTLSLLFQHGHLELTTIDNLEAMVHPMKDPKAYPKREMCSGNARSFAFRICGYT